jgi:uncharacterized membrane protein
MNPVPTVQTSPDTDVQTSPDTDRPDTALSRVISWLSSPRETSNPAADPRPVGVRDLAEATWMTALDVVSAIRTKRKARDRASQPVSASVTIHAPPAAVYAAYRELSELPAFMDYLMSVREADRRWSHWVARLPSGTIAWDVKITDDRPGELIAWRSVTGSVIDVRSRVSFAAILGGEATLVRIEIRLGAIATRRARGLARLFAAPQIGHDLRRFKTLLEAAAEDGRRARTQVPSARPSGQPGGGARGSGEHRQTPLTW